jgi:hypothetical protein
VCWVWLGDGVVVSLFCFVWFVVLVFGWFFVVWLWFFWWFWVVFVLIVGFWVVSFGQGKQDFP